MRFELSLVGRTIFLLDMKKAPLGALFQAGFQDGRAFQPPQLRTGPQSIWTKFERE